MELPSWFGPPPPTEPPPKPRNRNVPTSEEGRALMFAQFEVAFPRVIDAIYAGSTLNNAIRDLRPLIVVDEGAFWRWLRKQPDLYAMYKEAVEARTEVWTGRMLQRAEGLDDNGEATLNDVTRDKLVVDQYKWLIQAQNRREYGDVKQIQVDQQISIVGAIEAARARTRTIVEAEVVDVDLLDDEDIKQLSAGSSDEEDDDG